MGDSWAGGGYTYETLSTEQATDFYAEAAECPNCGEHAEPEQDGDVTFFACACGMEFGYYVVTRDASCQLGIPEDVRRAASKPEGVFLGSAIPVGPPHVQA